MDYDFDLLGDALDRAVDADTVAPDVQPEHMGSVVPSLVAPSLHEAFTNWNAQSTSRLDAQVRDGVECEREYANGCKCAEHARTGCD